MKTRSEKRKKKSLLNKIMVVGISLLSIISLAFTIYVFNGLFSTKELLTSKPNVTHTKQTEKPNHYANELEKESKLKEEMEKQQEKESEQTEDTSDQSQTSQNASNEEESYSYTYTVDSIENSEIYASSMQEGQVYFTQSLVKDNVELSVGDTILVNFSSNEMDSITSVELVFAVNNYEEDQTEQTEAEIQNDKAFEELEKRTEELKKEVNENYEAVTGNKDTSYNVKEVTIESVDAGEYTATNGITFTSDQVYNGIEFEEGDNATVIYDENGNLFEVNDGIMSEDGSYVSESYYQ